MCEPANQCGYSLYWQMSWTAEPKPRMISPPTSRVYLLSIDA
jgi:hypothetical protein